MTWTWRCSAMRGWSDGSAQPQPALPAGGVTFCALMPMRAIPFEVVCLLGMNDGDYPGAAACAATST